MSWRRVRDHHTHTRRISSRHLSILLEQACVLDLWVTISKLVLLLFRRPLAPRTMVLIKSIIRLLDHRIDLIVLELAVT